jgi:hypothetical protein
MTKALKEYATRREAKKRRIPRYFNWAEGRTRSRIINKHWSYRGLFSRMTVTTAKPKSNQNNEWHLQDNRGGNNFPYVRIKKWLDVAKNVTMSSLSTKALVDGDTLILKYATADVLQNTMQSKSKSKKELSDLQQKYGNGFVRWINNTVTNIYFNRLTCAPQYHSTSDAPCTLKIASCEAKLPHNTHLLRLSFWRLPTSGTGNSDRYQILFHT